MAPREPLRPAPPAALLRAGAALLVLSTPALAQEAATPRIEAVTLSSGGLAEIRRGARLDGSGTLTFDVPLEQVDDILKSLVLRDPAGRVSAMSLDGLSPVEETFARLPFTPADLDALPALLATLKGVRVAASSGGRSVEGVVLGVEIRAGGEEGEAAEPLLSVLRDDGRIAVLRLRADAEIEILDAALRERIAEAAAVSGRGAMDTTRTIDLSVEGDGERGVVLDYVVPAPVWKTAYRLSTGDGETARLQAWAVIENASGEDWDGVELTLSSGAPVTLAQRLHQRYWHERPELPVEAQTTARARADAFKGAAPVMEQAARSPAAFLSAEAPPPAPMPQAADMEFAGGVGAFAGGVGALAEEGTSTATYEIPFPVDLAAGRTYSVPFIDAELEAERIALFQPERGEVHPVSALMLENSTGTSLPPGILTVYGEAEGYLGDAELRHLPGGESRMVSFAADRKVEIRSETQGPETVERASLVDGLLRVTRTDRQTTRYEITGALDAPRTVLIEHPRMEGWRFSSGALDSQTPTHHRLRVEVEAGGSASAEAVQEQTRSERVALLDTDLDTLLFWSGEIGEPEDADALRQVAERRRVLAEAERELSRIEAEIAEAEASQARIRDNLAAVPDESALAERYVGMLEAEEDRIGGLGERKARAQDRLDALAQDLGTFIREL